MSQVSIENGGRDWISTAVGASSPTCSYVEHMGLLHDWVTRSSGKNSRAARRKCGLRMMVLRGGAARRFAPTEFAPAEMRHP